MFVVTQTVRHRDFFLPVTTDGRGRRRARSTPTPPTDRAALISLGLLVLALVAVVGAGQGRVAGDRGAGSPPPASRSPFVGVVIALLVLLPETLAAVRAARRDRIQTSLNLAFGSAMASIGLTIPAIAVASIWLDGPLLARPRSRPRWCCSR